MKKLFLTVLFVCASLHVFAQNNALPRLAVVEFTVANDAAQKTKRDAITIRDQVRSDIVKTSRYEVIARAEIDKLLADQKIQLSALSSSENIKKLQLLNINYLITGAVNDADDYYSIVIDILDVSNGKFVNSDNELVPGRQPDLNKGVSALVTRFLSGMTSQGGTVAQRGNVRDSYRIGDTGPAGGLIFYDKGNNSDGWRYLEAAPKDLGWAEWGYGNYENENWGPGVSGTGTAIGRGKRNTQLIVDALKRGGYTGRAAQLCASFNHGGYTDWFLPSKDELDLLYKNLATKGLGGFTGDLYWSSSEGNTNNAWLQSFSDGYRLYDTKGLTRCVRAVRAF